MSIIVKIRERFSWIIVAFLAIALTAFILEDGLSTGSSVFGGSEDVGEVDGQDITKTDFQQDVDNIQKTNPNAKIEEIIPYVWQNTLNDIVLTQAASKAGIVVGKKEVDDIIFGQESPFAREFTDQKTGEFKVNDLRNSLAQLKKSKDETQRLQVEKLYIEPAIQQRLGLKYQYAILQSIYVPSWYAEKMNKDNALLSKVNYVFENYANLEPLCKNITVTNDDIESYLEQHPKLYQNDNDGRNIRYVRFAISPSHYDSIETQNAVSELKNDLKKAKTADDVQKVANLNNVQVNYNKDLYSPLDKVKPTIKDSLKKYVTGDVIGPFIEGNAYELDKIVSIKKRPDSASVRHILIMTKDPQTGREIRTEEQAKKIIDSIEKAIKSGSDFTALCTKYSEDPGSKDRGGFYPYFGQGHMVTEFNDFSFDNQVGKKGVVKTVFGYHYIEVLNQKDFSTMYNVAYFTVKIEPGTETINDANNRAASFAAQCSNGNYLDSIANLHGLIVEKSTAIKQNDYTIQGFLGSSRNIVRWIFDNDVNVISEPFQSGDNLYVLTVSGIVKKGLMTVAEAKQFNIEPLVKNHKIAVFLAENNFKNKSITDFAKLIKKPVQQKDSLNFGFSIIPEIGYELKFTGACFNPNFKGNNTPLFEGNLGMFMVQVLNISSKPDLADIKTTQENQKGRLKASMQNFFETLVKHADVEDNRYLFY